MNSLCLESLLERRIRSHSSSDFPVLSARPAIIAAFISSGDLAMMVPFDITRAGTAAGCMSDDLGSKDWYSVLCTPSFVLLHCGRRQQWLYNRAREGGTSAKTWKSASTARPRPVWNETGWSAHSRCYSRCCCYILFI